MTFARLPFISQVPQSSDISPELRRLLDGMARQIGNNKRDATTGPTADDDNTAGWHIGSRWLDVTADEEYVCLDATEGAAVWKQTT